MTYKEQIKNIIDKIKHSPTEVLIFIKNSLISFIKVWGSSLFIITLLFFIYFTGAYKIIYFKIKLDIETYSIEHLEEKRKEIEKNIIIRKKTRDCIKNQIIRTANSLNTEINYCK